MTGLIDPQAAAQACRDIERRLMQVPEHILVEAKRRQEIAAHNAEIDKARVRKKNIKAVKKMLRRAMRG